MTFRTDWDTAPNPAYDIWTVTNGGEVVPGILTPFTATSFNRSDSLGLRALMAEYDGGDKVSLFDPPIGNFFGVAAGRLTINAGFSCAAMSALDGQIAEAMLLQFFTGAEGTEKFVIAATDEERATAYATATRQREEAPARLAQRQSELYAERRSDQAAKDRALPLADAWTRHEALTEENAIALLNLHYVVSTAAGEFAVRLAGLLAAVGQDPGLIVPLCSGLGDVESSKPAIALYDLASLARTLPTVRSAIESESAEAVLAKIHAPADDAWRAFANTFAEFLVLYGFRVQGEADPLNADWSEQPTFAISQVRTMLSVADEDSPRAQQGRASQHREALERDVRSKVPADLQPMFDELLAKAQHFTRLRETSKATWVLGTRRQRATWLAIADGVAAAGVCPVDDVRFLTHDEVAAIATGGSVPDAAAVIERRKVQFAEASEYVLPDSWVGEATPERRGDVSTATELTGLGVSSGGGVVRGNARIVPDVQATFERDIEVGEILIAPFTDAPWTPLFIPAGAVVVETGGMLSHAATVAREFGIPCVVMVKDATRIIRDGDLLEVDGAAGTVKILQRA